MNMVEKVARAMHEYSVKVDAMSPQWIDLNNVPPTAKAHLFAVAKAAIEAMKEPTKEMLDAGPGDPYMDAYVWEKMIKAALKE